MSKIPFEFEEDSPGETSLSSAVKQVLFWASDEDGDYSVNVLHDALLEYLSKKQSAINTRHEQEISVMKERLVQETSKLRAIIEDRRNRVGNLLEAHWPGIWDKGDGDVAAFALLEKHVARLVEENNRHAAKAYRAGKVSCAHCGDKPPRFPTLPMMPHERVDPASGYFICQYCESQTDVHPVRVVGVDPGWPGGFTILSMSVCDNCGGSGRLLSQMPAPVSAEQENAENEPYEQEVAAAGERDKQAIDYMGVWNHYQCAYNAVQHRESSDRHFKIVLELCEAILGRKIPWDALSGIETIAMMGIAKAERRNLEQKIRSNVQTISHLQAALRSTRRGTS